MSRVIDKDDWALRLWMQSEPPKRPPLVINGIDYNILLDWAKEYAAPNFDFDRLLSLYQQTGVMLYDSRKGRPFKLDESPLTTATMKKWMDIQEAIWKEEKVN